MSKHTPDEEEIRDEIKRRKKLRETREEREQLVRQIADEEGLPPKYFDIETSDTEDHIPVEEELLNDDPNLQENFKLLISAY